MRFLFVLAALFLSIQNAHAVGLGRAYIDQEDGIPVSIFNKEGMEDWKACRDDSKCSAIGWPDNTAEITVLSLGKPKIQIDPDTGQKKTTVFAKVSFKYVRDGVTKTGTGYMDASPLTNSAPESSFYGASAEKKYCPEAKETVMPDGTISYIGQIQRALTAKSVGDTAALIKGSVGSCVIDPKRLPAQYSSGVPYDTYVLPNMSKKTVPAVVKEDGSRMSRQDLIDIDAVARTIYAELGWCYKHGLQYPMAVAKVITNRATAINEAKANNEPRKQKSLETLFINGQHSSTKGNIAKAANSPTQFHVWKQKNNKGQRNGPLTMALCPPSDPKKNFYQGNPPSRMELEMWDNTIKIATEAVLFPQRFNKRTSQITQTNFTGAETSSFYGMKEVPVSIEKRRVSNRECVQIWE